MRVSTFHRHTVHRASPLLSGLIIAHSFHSFFFCFPLFLLQFACHFISPPSSSSSSLFLSLFTPQGSNPLWIGLVIFFWIFFEGVRMWWGTQIHRYGHIFYGIGFSMLSLSVQLLLIGIYWGAISNGNELIFGACLTQVIGLVVESVLGISWVSRVGKHEWVNFFIRLGAIQRQGVMEEMPASFFKKNYWVECVRSLSLFFSPLSSFGSLRMMMIMV